MGRTKFLIILILLFSITSENRITSNEINSDTTGIYELNVNHSLSSKEPVYIEMDMSVTGINKQAMFYNQTVYEKLNGYNVTILELGLFNYIFVNKTLITNTNHTLIGDPNPIYKIEEGHVQTFSQFNIIDPGSYTLKVEANITISILTEQGSSEFSHIITANMVMTIKERTSNNELPIYIVLLLVLAGLSIIIARMNITN